jgi:WD40 repeat protein
MGQSSQLASWDAISGKVVKQVPLPIGQEPAWSPNGKTAAYLGQDGVTVLDMTMGQTLAHIPGQWVGNLAISPDGSLLAARNQQSAANSPSIVIWETVSGKKVAELAAGPAHNCFLSGDNRTVVTMDEKSIRVWDLATRREKHQVALSKTSSSVNPNQFGMRATAHLTPDGRRLLTPESDGTLLIWDLSPAFPSQISESKSIEPERIAGWWTDLAQADPAVAYAAVWKLTEAPESAVGLFQKQMKPAVDADFEKVRKLVKELDDDRFEVRDKASRELEKMGALIQPALRHFLEAQPPPEVRRRLEILVQNSSGANQSPELLRQLRAVGILERIGSKGARQVLATLATGVPYAPETQAAKTALERLGQ